jgi:hypothetical protein
MGPQLSDKQREEIWYVLSSVFVDTEVNYWRIAARLNEIGADIFQLKEIFFEEVAPVLGLNAMSTIPVEWVAFMKDDVHKAIREKLASIHKSPFAWYRYKAFLLYCRWRFKNEWKSIVAALEKRRSFQNG